MLSRAFASIAEGGPHGALLPDCAHKKAKGCVRAARGERERDRVPQKTALKTAKNPY
jgi:hypothetical protein